MGGVVECESDALFLNYFGEEGTRGQCGLLCPCSVDKEFELPTLIHLAAKFGFKELCARLIDLPDASHAGKFSNRNGQQPNEIARVNKHVELCRFLDNFLEMVGNVARRRRPVGLLGSHATILYDTIVGYL